MTYKIIRKKNVKRLILKIEGNQILVSAPIKSSKKEIDIFVKKNEEWILNHLQSQWVLKEKDILTIQNKIYHLHKSDKNERIHQDLYISSQKGLYKIIYEMAQPILINKFNLITKSLSIDSVHLNIKIYKSQWGNCYYKKRLIHLNAYLICFPDEFIDSVIIHELAHLYYHNHSKDFYDLVFKWDPDYKNHHKNYQIPKWGM